VLGSGTIVNVVPRCVGHAEKVQSITIVHDVPVHIHGSNRGSDQRYRGEQAGQVENEHDARRILGAIQGRVADGVSKALAVEPYLPVDHSSKRVGVLLVKWMEEMEELESKGRRSENTLRDYRRWTKVGGEHAYLLRLANRSIHAIVLPHYPRVAEGDPAGGKVAEECHRGAVVVPRLVPTGEHHPDDTADPLACGQ